MARQHPFDQQLQLATRSLLAKDARLDHLGVVEHQQIAWVQQLGQFVKDPVHHGGRGAVQQARATALGGRVLGDQCGGEVEIEIAEGEGARERD